MRPGGRRHRASPDRAPLPDGAAGAWTTGARPKPHPVTIASPPAKSSARQLSWAAHQPRRVGRQDHLEDRERLPRDQQPGERAEARDRTMLSVSSCRATRRGAAPSAVRMPISRSPRHRARQAEVRDVRARDHEHEQRPPPAGSASRDSRRRPALHAAGWPRHRWFQSAGIFHGNRAPMRDWKSRSIGVCVRRARRPDAAGRRPA